MIDRHMTAVDTVGGLDTDTAAVVTNLAEVRGYMSKIAQVPQV